MSKPAVNYLDLLGLLQTYETDNQLQKSSINLVGGYSSRSRSFRKGKKNKRKKKQLVPHAGGQISKKRDKADKSQAECFFCKKLGY